MSPFLPHGHQRLFMGWPWETEGKVHEAGRSPTVGSPWVSLSSGYLWTRLTAKEKKNSGKSPEVNQKAEPKGEPGGGFQEILSFEN